MHSWGDEWFEKYGNDLYEAQNFIYTYVYRHSLVRLMSKEKWGTLRYEFLFPPFSSIRFGPHLYVPFYRKNTKYGKVKVFIWVWNCSWLHKKWTQLGHFMLRKAIAKAIRKWPHLEKELISDLRG